MTDADLAALTARLLWGAFAIGIVFGVVAERTRFCTMGAVSDVVAMGDWTRARAWALAVAVAMLGFATMVGLGWVRAADTFYAAPRLVWLSNLVGGGLFGVGMALASGCGGRSLVRAGAGNLKSLVVLIVLALSGWATIRGVTALLRDRTVDRVAVQLATGQDVPSLLGGAMGAGAGALPARAWLVGGLVAAAIAALVLMRREGRQREVLLAGVGIGGSVTALWWLSGVAGFVPEHPQTLEPVFLATSSQRMESFSFVAPLAFGLEWLVFASDTSRRLTIGICAAFGVLVGSMAVALATRSFRWEGFGGTDDLARHLVGATLMGVGGVTAMGCTIGQGITGVSTLSVGSFLALAAMIGGARLGLRWQMRRIEREA